jgi:ABC-2 type transport system ATP-binding protein
MIPVLEARELTKRYGGATAVRNVSFKIGGGSVLGVLGPNGAGKSTIVKMVTGLLSPSGGAVWFRGARIDADLSGFKCAVGYVPEQAELYGFLTGWEYLDFVATLRRVPHRRFREKATSLLHSFTLYNNRDLPINSYSKGMRQRIVLIAALLHDPELLVLDEPFTGLDVTSALVLRRVIGRLAAKGRAIFFSSPVLEQVDRLCSHLVLLKRGSVAAAGPIAEVRARFHGEGLEQGVMQLTEQTDVDRVADEIVAAVCDPAN